MDRPPLLFLFKNTVQGNGFQAYVTAQGRALVERGAEEEGEVWVTGVQPGGIAEGAQDEQQAYEKFNTLYTPVLADAAAEAKNFDMFTNEDEPGGGQGGLSCPPALAREADIRAGLFLGDQDFFLT